MIYTFLGFVLCKLLISYRNNMFQRVFLVAFCRPVTWIRRTRENLPTILDQLLEWPKWDQSAARPVISVARHGATCSFKSNNVFMTPTGEYNQYTCNMLIRREYRTLLLPTKQDKLLVNAIIRLPRIVDQLLKPGRQNTTNIGFCWIFDILWVYFS